MTCSYSLVAFHDSTETACWDLESYLIFFFYLQCTVCVGQDLLQVRSYVYAEEPNIDIHHFVGTFTRVSGFALWLQGGSLGTWPDGARLPTFQHGPYLWM